MKIVYDDQYWEIFNWCWTFRFSKLLKTAQFSGNTFWKKVNFLVGQCITQNINSFINLTF